MSLLDIQNLTVDYQRRGNRIPAVRDFSLAIGAGETVGLVGESGSGKSTVALAILRLIRPQEGRIVSGRILFEGRDLLTLPENDMRRLRGGDIAMVFQDPFTSLNPVMTIREQMEEAVKAGESPNSATRLIVHLLEQVQLNPQQTLSRYPHQLSGGQRQRICIAMALLNNPKLLLADEPTTALDVLVQKEILELLAKLQRDRGVAMLFITHNLRLIKRLATRVVSIQKGQP